MREPDQHTPRWGLFAPRTQLVAAFIMGTLLLAGLLTHWQFKTGTLNTLAHTCDWTALAIGLVYGGRAALDAARKQLVDIDVLMVAAAVLAAAIGAPAEGALLLFLFTLAGALEDLAMERTTRSVSALHKLIPTAAQRWNGTSWEHAAPESLATDDRIRILPGEQVPTDARVTLGTSSINQASITGESQPRDVREGDELFAGTVNAGSVLEATVTRPASESSLQKVLRLVTEAQQQREPVQQLIDRLSQPYAVAVFAAAIIVFVAWWLMGFAPAKAAYTAIALLIVASPCALVIATPTATLTGISRAARGGVLFKGGKSIQRLAQIAAVCFDKTGTLTVGRPVVQRVESFNADGSVSSETDRRAMLAEARALEETSTHPIAEAVVAHAKTLGIDAAAVRDARYVTGRGVVGIGPSGEVHLGSLAHTGGRMNDAVRARVQTTLESIQHRGMIGVTCVSDRGVLVIILADAVRPGAECLVDRLHELGVAPVVMLTGDNTRTAKKVADQLRLDAFHAELMPADKVSHVKQLKSDAANRGGIGVIGDGVNDAPALALADAAIAIGSIGSDAALENADIVLLADDLSAVPWAVALARRVRRTITINLVFALTAMTLMAIGVLVGSLLGWTMPLWMGVIGHEGGTLLVVAHSLILLTHRGVPMCPMKDKSRGGGVELRIEGKPIAA